MVGDGIINLANVGWIIVLAAGYYGVVKYDTIPVEKRQKVEELIGRIGLVSPVYIVVGSWLFLRMLFLLGWQMQLELLAVLFTCSFAFRQVSRTKLQFYNKLRQELTESKDPTLLLGTNLPEWVLFPSANRVQWLNTMLQSLWPSIVAATEVSIRNSVEPILQRSKPSFVYAMSLKSASVGPNPIVVNGVQHHQYGTTETTLDINMSWSADMDIKILMEVPGPDMTVSVKDFETRMVMRVTMGPHVPVWPCFANMALSIVGTPEMDFNFSAGKLSLDAVPGLGAWLDDFIRHTLVGLMAYPKGIVVPIVKGYTLNMGRAAGALGTLKIKMLRIEDLLSKYSKYKKTPFYLKIVELDKDKKRVRSKSYTGFDSKLTDAFSFVLYDNTGKLRIWMYFDVVGSDVLVGEIDVPTQQLIDSAGHETELALVKPSDASKKRRVSLMIMPEFKTFNNGEANTEPPNAAAPPRHASPEFAATMSKSNRAPAVPRSRGGSPRADDNDGTLFITVVSASNLKNREKLSTSDPYVLLDVNGITTKSDYISSNLNPTFNFEGELPINDPETDMLKVSLIDKNDVGADKLMGYTEIPVKKVMLSRGERIEAEFDLDPQGKVKLILTLLRHGV